MTLDLRTTILDKGFFSCAGTCAIFVLCREIPGPLKVMQMPLFDTVAAGSRSRWCRLIRKNVSALLAVAALTSNAVVGAENPESGTLSSMVESTRLRMDARIAAERGDFADAAALLESAALKVGDRRTADRARVAQDELQVRGGSMADFQPLMNLILEQTAPPALWTENGDDPGGSMTEFLQGVFVGVPGMARALTITNDHSRLNSAFEYARTANVNEDVRIASGLRLVSLPRLEAEVTRLVAAGAPIPEEVACLAGLSEVQFLFVFPETRDVVIGGPAGAWKTDEKGRTISLTTERPTLHLDDLVTLSRTFSSSGSGFFMCSIDPKPEQVRAVREYVQQNPLTSGNTRKFTDKLESLLGMQNVIVQGIPQDSRVASVIVDADYQMKLVGIGERRGSEGMKSYFELISKSERRGAAMDALRWWMTVGYDSIEVSPNQMAFEFTGREVQCLSENQLVNADGSRQATGKSDGANAEFAELFTQHLPELAKQDVIFADLQNVFDLGLATALIHTMGLAQQVGWHPTTFAEGGNYRTTAVEVPAELMTAANSRVYRTGEIVIQVAGGVRADLREVVRNPENFEISPAVAKEAAKAHPIGQTGRWWWDAAIR